MCAGCSRRPQPRSAAILRPSPNIGSALNAHSYWLLREQGLDANRATERSLGLSVAAKNELLFQAGVNFNDLPTWQKRGLGVYWETRDEAAVNPKTGEQVVAQRRRLRSDLELPMGAEYDGFVAKLAGA